MENPANTPVMSPRQLGDRQDVSRCLNILPSPSPIAPYRRVILGQPKTQAVGPRTSLSLDRFMSEEKTEQPQFHRAHWADKPLQLASGHIVLRSDDRARPLLERKLFVTTSYAFFSLFSFRLCHDLLGGLFPFPLRRPDDLAGHFPTWRNLRS